MKFGIKAVNIGCDVIFHERYLQLRFFALVICFFFVVALFTITPLLDYVVDQILDF